MPDFKSILVQVDASNPSPSVLKCATQIAREKSATLELIDVVADSSWSSRLLSLGIDQAVEKMVETKSAELAKVAEEIQQTGLTVSSQVSKGKSSVEIVREVLKNSHELVIRETKGARSQRSGFFGTTATRLLRTCPCPLLLLKPDHPWQPKRVVAAVDATTDDEIHARLNQRIIRIGNAFCEDLNDLQIVCGWKMYGEEILVGHMQDEEFEKVQEQAKHHSEHRLDDLVMEYGLGIGSDNVHLLHGEGGQVIPDYVAQHETDLLVMGTIARSGVAGLLIGNTAEQILNRVECSVLTVKPDGFQSPISP